MRAEKLVNVISSYPNSGIIHARNYKGEESKGQSPNVASGFIPPLRYTLRVGWRLIRAAGSACYLSFFGCISRLSQAGQWNLTRLLVLVLVLVLVWALAADDRSRRGLIVNARDRRNGRCLRHAHRGLQFKQDTATKQ